MNPLEPNDPRTLHEKRYTLRSVLGEGSMGRTYLADDSVGGHAVAIKALYPSRLATVKDLELFTREADVLQRLSHPRIPAYIDAFCVGTGEAACYYLVQTYVEGPTLRERLNEGARWSEAELVEFALELLTLLDYLHGCDPTVVHRDIKPDNVILRADDGKPALVDFGAVREVVRLTMGGGSTIIGTYGYMPPEQLMGSAVPASDLYSVGITLLEMLTRQTPSDLRGEDAKRLVEAANVSEGVRRVLGRLCAPRLDDRYDDATAVISDLREASSGGALTHAVRLEQAIVARERAEALALKRASTPGIVSVGYITLVALVALTAIGAMAFVLRAMLLSFDGAFLLAGTVSGVTVVVMACMLMIRYTHDAWEPPSIGWRRTRGEILWQREARNEIEGSVAYNGWRVRYGFPVGRGTYEHELLLSSDTNLDRFPVGTQFDVYYREGNPAYHEIQDFRHDPDQVMSRLFDYTREHTPE